MKYALTLKYKERAPYPGSFLFSNQRAYAPRTLKMSMMIATMRRIWINPPSVKEVITPRSQRIMRMSAMVSSIYFIS